MGGLVHRQVYARSPSSLTSLRTGCLGLIKEVLTNFDSGSACVKELREGKLHVPAPGGSHVGTPLSTRCGAEVLAVSPPPKRTGAETAAGRRKLQRVIRSGDATVRPPRIAASRCPSRTRKIIRGYLLLTVTSCCACCTQSRDKEETDRRRAPDSHIFNLKCFSVLDVCIL